MRLKTKDLVADLERWKNIPINYRKRRKKEKWTGCDGERYQRSLEPFDDHNCIFIHIPKAAGLSISYSLFGQMTGGHMSAYEYRQVFGRDFYKYFKFTFVRNPFSRIASAYAYLMGGGHPAFPNDIWFKKNILQDFESFEDFVVGWVTPDKGDWIMPHFQPQSHFLKWGNETTVDFVGRVENIVEDFAYVSSQLGIDAELQERNTSEGTNYYDFYSSNIVRNRIKNVYSEDFELLDYQKSVSSIKKG